MTDMCISVQIQEPQDMRVVELKVYPNERLLKFGDAVAIWLTREKSDAIVKALTEAWPALSDADLESALVAQEIEQLP